MSAEERAAEVLATHADCALNAAQDLGSSMTGHDVWSCGISIPFADELEDAERMHYAKALAAAGLLADRANAERDERLRAAAVPLAALIAAHRLTTPVQCKCGWRETDPFCEGTWATHLAGLLADRANAERDERLRAAAEALLRTASVPTSDSTTAQVNARALRNLRAALTAADPEAQP